jgi:N-acetylmuramoyl-L-alanine amidase
MDLRKHYLTKNDCYKTGDKITVIGLMIHSTGANNPRLARYVDAPELDNVSSSHWNQPKPGGRSVCVHGFIGLDGDKVATYQTLPWNHRGWGGGGESNNTHIHVEICEGDLDDAGYFAKVYKEAVELFAYLCEKFNLNPMDDVITHSEGHKMGIASNHADVMHWFPKHGKNMDTFRNDILKEMQGDVVEAKPVTNPSTPVVAPKPAPTSKSIDQLAREVIDGDHGAGDARRKALGSNYDAVQDRVNELLGGAKVTTKPAPEKPKAKTVTQLAHEVIDGEHGSGDARRKSLGKQYDAVQKKVNELLGAKSRPASKSINQLVEETIRGEHGSGRERMLSLGSNYAAVQKEVNRRLR